MILDQIIELKRKEIARLKYQRPFKLIEKTRFSSRKAHCLIRVLKENKHLPHLICEMKKASPSEGIMKQRFSPALLCREFEKGGAAAISILTERNYFRGNSAAVSIVRKLTNKPILRKDFIIDEYQIVESRWLGADAILLIVSILSDREIAHYLKISKDLGLDAIVEAHNATEIKRAVNLGAQIIGMNNRNLRTLDIDVKKSENLIEMIPRGVMPVVESGISKRQDIVRYQNMGIHSFLIGSILMKSKNIPTTIRELRGELGCPK